MVNGKSRELRHGGMAVCTAHKYFLINEFKKASSKTITQQGVHSVGDSYCSGSYGDAGRDDIPCGRNLSAVESNGC